MFFLFILACMWYCLRIRPVFGYKYRFEWHDWDWERAFLFASIGPAFFVVLTILDLIYYNIPLMLRRGNRNFRWSVGYPCCHVCESGSNCEIRSWVPGGHVCDAYAGKDAPRSFNNKVWEN